MTVDSLAVPLFVDLDGTLIKTDLLWESLASVSRADPLAAVTSGMRVLDGRAALKQSLARHAAIDPATLPYREDFVAWLREQARAGRRLVLATAANRTLAQSVADHLGFFSDVLASGGVRNLKGRIKLEAILEMTAGQPFDYCGDSAADLSIFRAARAAILVAPSARTLARAQAIGNVAQVFERSRHPGALLRAIRPHQWLKNLLVFVPLFTAFKFNDTTAIAASVLAFIAFCLMASTGYLVNDLLDLGTDRQHPRKRLRPIASSHLSIPSVIAAGSVMFLVGAVLAGSLGRELLVCLLLYFVLTLAYSFRIKRVALFDVTALALLYTLRVLAGGAAVAVEISFWLLAFSAFLFFSLALVKRTGELVALRDRGEETTAGRAYTVTDLSILQPLGIATSVATVLVFALFTQSSDVAARYSSPGWLWLTLAALLLWITRLWLATNRGEMHDDPLVYAASNGTSLMLLVAMAVGFAAAVFA